ncbi:phosphoenolpyruvate--protein phosphotransferase [Azospirillum picis]|uniref:phosphoenolpyruvate--protein phosphotransferase n=1 Tax=Azospirillum picis TaxID=488438 RepID=A0ABU0MID0_9PROT|nr:phosphoenolpyruvate--protein phosphotransferase [Azospirillum picis]MBP2299381.1 phosphocarrier protein FPr [Azospirillum picis]MDQ0532981.1 phosphocarrier protein FPr [Azospirillum picis]
MAPDTHTLSLPPDLVRLGARPASKEEAIREAAQLLIAAGCIDPAYADSMLKREAVANTFLGHGVAIPHGMVDDRDMVRRNGIAILQVPDGVHWNEGQTARLVVAIAAQSDAHIAVLRRLTRLMQDETTLSALFTTSDPAALPAALAGEGVGPAPAPAEAVDLAERFDWVVDYPTGLHARPATAWVETARAAAGRVRVRHGSETADAKTLVALLQLGLRPGDRITISADGPDAAAVLGRLRATITGLSAREKADADAAARKARVPVQGWTPPAAAGRRMPVVAGLGASPGLAIGPIHVMPKAELAVPDQPVALIEGGNRLHEALNLTRQQLKALADDTARRLGPSEAGIFNAQAELLNDTDLITLTCQLMVEGHGPAWSWNEAVERGAATLAANANPVLAGRAADLRDVGRRVLARIDPDLRGGSLRDLPDTPCILVADDLSPSDTAALDMGRVIGLATAQGGPTSHTAILARTLGLPAVVAGGGALTGIADGTIAILDGQSGRLYLEPGEADLASALGWIEEQRVRKAQQEERRGLPARTRDGHAVEIGANVNRPDQVPVALSQGAEGVGLMRTEFLFLERGDAPSEEEQYETYRAMLAALDGRPLIVRTLDIGGDKQVPHLQLPHEENPFLGVRGARLLLRHPELLEPQLRALYRAARDAAAGAGEGSLLIMFPMITSLREIEALRAACDRIRAELAAPAVPLGIMVEVPAAAIQADILARHVDFFSIGTNDLTQYALAIDRQHPELAAEADSLHPSVLRLIRMTVEGAAKHGRWVGVCGGIAGDPFGAALLAGLGVRELSMTPRDIPAVKDRLRDSDIAGLRALALKAVDCETADEVRALDGGAS